MVDINIQKLQPVCPNSIPQTKVHNCPEVLPSVQYPVPATFQHLIIYSRTQRNNDVLDLPMLIFTRRPMGIELVVPMPRQRPQREQVDARGESLPLPHRLFDLRLEFSRQRGCMLA